MFEITRAELLVDVEKLPEGAFAGEAWSPNACLLATYLHRNGYEGFTVVWRVRSTRPASWVGGIFSPSPDNDSDFQEFDTLGPEAVSIARSFDHTHLVGEKVTREQAIEWLSR